MNEAGDIVEIETWFWVPIADVRKVVNPLKKPRWNGVTKPISVAEVMTAVSERRLLDEHVGPGEFTLLATRGVPVEEALTTERRRHIERIARFVVQMPDDPVVIDVGMPEFGYQHATDFEVEDGHHRIAAAIIRDEDLLVSFCGSCDAFHGLFPTAIAYQASITPVL